MARKNRKNTSQEVALASLPERLGWWIVASFAFAIPLFISPSGQDSFRLPKDALFRAEGILLIALFLLAMTWKRISWREIAWRSPVILIPAAALFWTATATLLSSNRSLSILSLITVLLAAVIFVGTTAILRRRDDGAFLPLLLAASINGIVYLLQDLGFWNPFGMTSAFSGHNASTGFLGNANDVGSALLGPLLAAVATALSSSRRRLLNSAIGALLLMTLLVSRSITALIAAIVGLAGLGLMRWRQRAILPILLLLCLTSGLTLAVPQLRLRISNLKQMVERHEYDAFLSGRTTSFRAAGRMFIDHPVSGIGPGTFGWQYMPYKLMLDHNRGASPTTGAASRLNFEEVHNDHLEILAETGIPGYAIFLWALFALAAISFRKSEISAQQFEGTQSTARLLAFPLALSFFVLALAQYPLQLASSTAGFLFLTAACFAWRGSESL